LNGILENFKDIKFSNDVIEIEISEKNYSFIDIDKLNFENESINNLYVYINFKISETESILKQLDFRNEIKKILNHEFNHVIERYLTSINNRKYAESWEYGKKLQSLQKKYVEYDEILHFIYLSLPHEMRSRVSHMSQKLKNIDKKDIIDYIKNSKEYKDSDFLTKIDIDLILQKIKSYENYDNFIKDFTNIFLENNSKNYEKNFIIYIENLKNRNKKLKSKLLKTSYLYLNERETFNFGNGDIIDRDIDYNEYIR